MRITFSNDKLVVQSTDNPDVWDITTPKGNVMQLKNVSPTFNHNAIICCCCCYFTIPRREIQNCKVTKSGFLWYPDDVRLQVYVYEQGNLNDYPLWKCVKWKRIDDQLYIFNPMTQSLDKHHVSPDFKIRYNLLPLVNMEKQLIRAIL